MNIFAVPDLVRAIMCFLPDIRILRLNHELENIVIAEPEYTLWLKCMTADSIYSYATLKMLNGRADPLGISSAIEHDNTPVVKHLLAAGAEVESVPCETCSLATIQTLVDSGVNAELILLCAAEYGRVDIIDAYCNIEYYEPILATAAEHGKLNVVKQIFCADITSNTVQEDMLIDACIGMYIDLVKFLVDAGVEISESVIDTACYAGNINIARFLLGAGADVNVMLKCAAEYNCEDIIGAEISLGADPTNPELLDAACSGGTLSVIEQLKVDPTQGLKVACQRGKPAIVKYFISHQAKTDGMMWYAVKSHNLEVVKIIAAVALVPAELDDLLKISTPEVSRYLISLGASTTELESRLMRAIMANDGLIVEWLLDFGAPITHEVMMCAVKNSSVRVVKMLLDRAEHLCEFACEFAREHARHDVVAAIET